MAEGIVPQLVKKKGGSYSAIAPRLKVAKDTWTDLEHAHEGPSDTKENKIMDLKLEYNTFRAKEYEILSQTFTRYKIMLNELTNDGVKLSKYVINVGSINSLSEKWLSFSQGLRNKNHILTLELVDIYVRLVYEDNLVSKRYHESKMVLITAPISTAFFSNNIIRDFQENSDDKEDVRCSRNTLRT
nr:retrovirus-related Pol polyprotein from transposon TNT 1-94 [Tanacetum cinerariifolium]